MRTVSWTVFLVVGLQGIASASTTFASPIAADASAPAEAVSGPQAGASRLDAGEVRTQSSLRARTERKPASSEAQVLSKNFPRPKPVQIYWFFGGR